MASEQVEKRCSSCIHVEVSLNMYPCDRCVNFERWKPITEEDNISPAHYTRFKIQPLTFITENNLDYLQGNVIKYICRYPYKGGVTDLKKACRYLDELIKKEEGNEQPA